MNNDVDLNISKKVVLIMFAMIIFFVFAIIHAFDYIPAGNVNLPVEKKVATTEIPTDDNASVSEENTNDTNKEENKKTLNINLQNPDEIAVEEIKTIDTPPELMPISESKNINATKQNELSEQDEIELKFINAKKMKNEKQYINALEIYKDILGSTSDENTIARCYEEIAFLYAIQKHYGSALSFAQKAYNISPSSSREMLIARLYYKVGEIDKATKRISNILERDFSYDR